ncbi:MAG: hypothetical protein WCF78_04620 [archaeon]
MKNKKVITLKRYGSLRIEKRGLTPFLIEKKEHWPAFGEKNRFDYTYVTKFKNLPIMHLKSINKKNPKIMILGAGSGRELIELKDILKKEKINPEINVFSLTKSLDKDIEKKIVNKDYSINKAIENIDPKRDKQIIKENIGKYDLVVAPLSVGVYTDHVAYNMLLTSLLLRKHGKAYIEVNDNSQNLTRYKRFIELYNKQFTKNYEFIINEIKLDRKLTNQKYFEIIRTN